jgi:Sulfotransferase domain
MTRGPRGRGVRSRRLDAPKVLCVGFHKTGTSSFGRALQHLGYKVGGPFGVRDRDIASRALPQALDAITRVDAVQDNPWPLLYRDLDQRLPGSRFVLTVRPTDAWWASVEAHFGGRSTPMREWIYGHGAGDPVGHEARYRERYEQHNAEVTAWFADRPDDLLVLRLTEGEGWTELCGFLDRSVPDEPFPHVNAAGRATTVVNRGWSRARRLLRR